MSIKPILFTFILGLIIAGNFSYAQDNSLKQQIQDNELYSQVLEKSKDLLKTGFNAGEGYGEIWIRDFATFIEVASFVHPKEVLKEKLFVFFEFQGEDGNIVDGYIPREQAGIGYDYIEREWIPEYLAHKNTVETDQESSLVLAVVRYIEQTGDRSILSEAIRGETVHQRILSCFDFLLNHRFAKDYGLLWGATTADWGDVQPEHEWGVVLDENSHLAIDIYDNALFLLAMNEYIPYIEDKNVKRYWQETAMALKVNIRQHLWDQDRQKFVPHIYLEGSPFQEDFDEDAIYYHGGTAVAIKAGVLEPEEIKVSLAQMIHNAQQCGAATIGLTVYPPYPQGYFLNPSLRPYGYQNGGDWTWFGARMIHGLIEYEMIDEAITHLQPMLQRVVDNDGFFEWYDIYNRPRGSGTYRGSAGVLGKAIMQLQDWAEAQP